MGKRELLIIVAFVVVGTVVYQVTAPPSTGTRSFSLGEIFNSARREMRGNPGRATVTHTETLDVPATIHELRVLRVSHDVQVVGEARDTIEYAFAVTSTGPDDTVANEYATRTVLTRDEVGTTLILRAQYPAEASQTATLIIKVPARLVARVDNATGVTISGVSGAHIEAARGEITMSQIAGAVTGTHQDGRLTVSAARSVKVRLTRTRSRFEDVSGGLTLDLRDGDSTILRSAGLLEIDETRQELTITEHQGPVTVRGSDGRVTVTGPSRAVTIDVRRTEVEVALTRGVPVTVINTDQTVRLILRGAPAFTLNAATSDGAIQAADVHLTPETGRSDTRLTHVFGAPGGPSVTIRNTRGNIVIRKGA